MGDNTSSFLSGEEIDTLIRSGLTESEIARQFGVSVRAVHYKRFWTSNNVRRTGVYLTPSERAREMFPWRRVGQGRGGTSHSDYRALKAHSIWQVRHSPDDLGPDQLRRLVSFYRTLATEGLIVEFRPAIPPGEGTSFTRVPRTPEDGALLIRQNEWTDLDEVGMHEHWSFPTVYPEGAEDLARLDQEDAQE